VHPIALSEIDPWMQRLTGFAQELAGTLRRASVLELLVRHLRHALGPKEVVITLFSKDSEAGDVMHMWPPTVGDRRAVLELAGQQPLTTDHLEDALRAAALPVPADVSGSWALTPILARTRITGAVAIRAHSGALSPSALPLLQAFAAQASIALESARLVDLHDDGRRSWQEVVDAIALALCIVDRSGSIRRANRPFAELVGAPLAALIGRPWGAFVPPEWVPDIRRALGQAAGTPKVVLGTDERSYCISTVPIARGDSSATVLLFDDQTEQRRLQDQLIQSEKMSAIGQLIAGIAHDLNNPLASVVGFADFLSEARDVPAELMEPLSVIREEAERASNIVKNLLSFARKQERQRRPIALGALLDATLSLLRNQLLGYHVEASVELDTDLPMIVVDPNQLQQVFVNLINNAAQAIASTGRPGRIAIRARRQEDGVNIDVSDDGPGMSRELADQAFEPFFTTKGDGHGTGLGLSISQGIVKEHGGQISLVTREGEGSTFTVHLPYGEAAPLEPPMMGPAREPVSQLRVLVVDDEPHILHYMRATLEAWGHEVVVASDGAEGLSLAGSSEFDLIISDLRMPRLGGREFFEQLCAIDTEAAPRVIFSTGDTVRGDTLEFLESLDRPYLHKPFSLAELRATLAAVTSRRGA
jgi:signal transduction histidine kinase/ActR/RegA family two-component response regulator